MFRLISTHSALLKIFVITRSDTLSRLRNLCHQTSRDSYFSIQFTDKNKYNDSVSGSGIETRPKKLAIDGSKGVNMDLVLNADEARDRPCAA